MRQERNPILVRLVTAGATGVVLGFLGARIVLVGSALSLLPWALAGLAIGAWCRTLRGAGAAGGVFGAALAYTFMIAGYAGDSPLATRLLPFAVLALVGAVCGTALSGAGALARRVIRARAGADDRST